MLRGGQIDARRHFRAGFNLAELLFALTALAGLTVLAMTIVGLLVTAEQRTAESLWVDLTVANLAADLREDAHTAVDFEAAGDVENRVATLKLTQPDDVLVTYECTEQSVTRREKRDGEVQANEAYLLAFGTSWFEPPGDDGLIIWRHERDVPAIGGYTEPSPSKALPKRTYEIIAAIGLHAAIAGEVE